MSNFTLAQIENIKTVYEASQNDDLVIFVGAGISQNSGLPGWSELINELNNLLGNIRENDYLKVAQMYKDSVSSKEYYATLKKILCKAKVKPNAIHSLLLDLSPCHIITTNYDTLLEQAINDKHLVYSVIREDKDVPHTHSSHYLIKMHGDFVSGKLVLTENDYFNYSKDYPLINTLVKSLFGLKTVLFAGFSFNDLNLKIILNSVKSMLGGKNKPVYLLSHGINQDSIQYNYLRSKGIRPICLPDSVLEEKCLIELPEAITSDEGKNAYMQLYCIKNYISVFENVFDAIYDLSSKIEQQMPFFLITPLSKVLPKEFCGIDYRHSLGFQLQSPYIKELVNKCNTFSGRKEVLKAFGPKIKHLMQTAINNNILEFDYINLRNIKSFNRLEAKSEKSGIDYFYEFDFENLINRIHALEKLKLTATYKDLELPYLYWLLGNSKKAYNIYKKLEKVYWTSGKNILALICVFNRRALFRGPVSPGWDKYNDNEYNLHQLLSEQPINRQIKIILNDVLDYTFFSRTLIAIREYERAIIKNRGIADFGGASSNSNFQMLSSHILQCFSLSYTNYIITENSPQAIEVFRAGIGGILNTHKIIKRDSDIPFQTIYLPKLKEHHLKLMIFLLPSKDLNDIIDFNHIPSLSLDDSAVCYLQNIIDNIIKYKHLIKRTVSPMVISPRFYNLLLIIVLSNNDINRNSNIVDIVIEYNLLARNAQRLDFASLLYRFLEKTQYKLSKGQCVEIMKFLHNESDYYYYPPLFDYITHFIEQNHFKVDRCIPSDIKNIRHIYFMYNIISKKKQKLCEDYIKSLDKISEKDLGYFALLIKIKKANILTQSTLSQFLKFSKKTLKASALSVAHEYCDTDVRESIEKYAETDRTLQFFMNPIEYKDPIDIEWLPYVEDDIFKTLIARPDLKEKIKKIITDPEMDPIYNQLKNRYIKHS